MPVYTFESFGPYISGAGEIIDISHWQWGRDNQGNIATPPDYRLLKTHARALGIRAGSSRTDNGQPYVDYTFDANYQGAREAGFERVFSYWYWRALNPYGSARFFAGLINGKAFDAVVIDVEVAGSFADLMIFADELFYQLREPKPPIWIYTGPYAWSKITGNKARAVEFGLGIAHYEVNNPTVPEPWASAGIEPRWHQFTDDGPGAGQGWGIPVGAAAGLDLGWGHPEFFAEPSPPPPPPEEPLYVITNTSLNIRTAPVVAPATRIGAVPRGTQFEVVRAEPGGPWLAVVAYLHGDYVAEL